MDCIFKLNYCKCVYILVIMWEYAHRKITTLNCFLEVEVEVEVEVDHHQGTWNNIHTGIFHLNEVRMFLSHFSVKACGLVLNP